MNASRTSRSIGVLSITGATVLSTLHADVARAQLDDASAGALEEITVTAQRRSESAQDVPIAITAFTPAELERRNIQSTLDLVRYVPNLVGHNNTGLNSANSYYIRGIGNTESIATFDPPVGSYVDDIYIARQNANNFSFFDVERIEVLRGPQGTLFGRNTSGGAINVLLRKPAEEFQVAAEAGVGRYDAWELRSTVDVPVGPRLQTQFGGFFRGDGGYVRNTTTGATINGLEEYGARIALAMPLTDRLRWDLSGHYLSSRGSNMPNFACDPANPTVCRGRYATTGLLTRLPDGERQFPGLVITVPVAGAQPTSLADGKDFLPLEGDTRSAIVASNLQLELGGITASAITGYVRLDQDFVLDFSDGRGAPALTALNPPVARLRAGGFTIASTGSGDQFSQEFKLAGGSGDRLKYVTGLYYFHESNRSSFADVFTSTATRVPALLADRLLRNTTEAWAVYLQGDLKLTDALAVTLGARYTDETKDVAMADLRDPRVQPVAGGLPQRLDTANIRAFGVPTEQGTEQWTPRLALNFDASENVLLFATATKGFRSGGWNARSTSANLFLPFGPEKVWAYELGAKSEWLDRRLRANATAFAVDVEDFQIPAAFVNPLTGALTFISGNFAGLRNRGVEVELQAVPFPEFNVYANIGYQDASYVDVNAATLAQQGRCAAYLQSGGAPLPGVQGCGQGLVTVTGGIARPVRTPKVTASLGGSYEFRLGAGDLRLTPSINLSYTDDQETGATNLSFYEANGVANAVGNGAFVTGSFSESHWLTDAAVAIGPEDGRWRVSAECSNCFDRDYVQSTTSNYSYLNAPGRWMLRFRYRFGSDNP